MVRTPRHVFAFINGVAYDEFKERPDRCIYAAYKFTRKIKSVEIEKIETAPGEWKVDLVGYGKPR